MHSGMAKAYGRMIVEGRGLTPEVEVSAWEVCRGARHGHGYDAAWPSPVKIRTPAGLARATLEIVPSVDRPVQSTCVWPN